MKTKIFGQTIAIAATVAIFSGGISPSVRGQDAPPPDSQNSQAGSAPADALPPDIQANASLVEVINLSQASMSEEVINNYINNSPSRFNLTASQLIYLRDIGIPDSAVVAMQQRDSQLGEAPAQTAQATAPAPPPATTAVTEDYFDDSLAPYGNWVVVEGYGRCWRPAVVVYNSNWQPYCDDGHWVWTDAGWYWYSDYSWGWATFHYGRWFQDSHYGWCWAPDTVWGPSWVCWRQSDDYCGWAPLPPHCEYREGVGLFFNGSRVSVGFDFGLSIGAFTFVATHDFCDPHPWQHRIDRGHVTQIYNRTTVINNITVNNNGGHNTTIINNGISHDHIAAAAGRPIPQVTIRESTSPVRRGEHVEGGNTLVINRPNFDHNATPNENRNAPHTIPSPTTGQPMQVPPPNQNRNNNLPQHNQSPVQNRNSSPNGTPVQSSNGNENRNRNSENQNSIPVVTQPQQNGAERFGSTLPPAQTRTEPQTPSVTPNPSLTPNRAPESSTPRMVSPRYQQQRGEPRTYSEPNAQPSPRVEMPQSEPHVYQPSQPQPQVVQPSQPSQNPQPERRRDKNEQ